MREGRTSGMPPAASGNNSSGGPRNAPEQGPPPPPLSPRSRSRTPPFSPRRASSLPADTAGLSVSNTGGGGGAGGRRKDGSAGISLAEEGYEAGRSPRSTRRTGSRLGRCTAGMLSALGLLALAPLRATLRASSSSPSPPAPPGSTAAAPAPASSPASPRDPTRLPAEVDLSPFQVDGVLTTPGAGGGAGAAAGAAAAAPDALPWGQGAAAATRKARSDQPGLQGPQEGASLSPSSPSSGDGGLGEGVARDGRPRCWTDEEGGGRCLPTVFFVGVSKCGTSSLSHWLAEHPRAVLVTPQHVGKHESHVFDASPKYWHELTPQSRRERLSPVAAPGDTVVDFTPNYSVIGEAPLRISDLYGSDDSSRLRRNLRFLVLLREPAARVISSWMYKSDPVLPQPALHLPNGTVFEGSSNASTSSSAAATPNPGNFSAEVARGEGRSRAEGRRRLPPQTATAAARGEAVRPPRRAPGSGSKVTSHSEQSERGRRWLRLALVAAEQRPLREAFREGVARVESLAGCVKNATESGLFGREATVTFCRATKGPKQCKGNPPCELCNTHTEPWCNPRDYLEETLYNAHVGKSMYAMQLRRWFGVFGRESFKVVFTEDMQAYPVKTLTEVLDFLGLDLLDPEGKKGLRSPEMWDAIVGARHNEADEEKKKVLDPQVTPELREEMRAFFAPHNRDLEELLGIPLPESWGVQ